MYTQNLIVPKQTREDVQMNSTDMDSKGRNWKWIIYYGAILDVELKMPTLVKGMRSIVTILTEGGNFQEAKAQGERIWGDTEILYHGLYAASNDTQLTEDARKKSEDLAGIIEEFQHLMIRELGVTLP